MDLAKEESAKAWTLTLQGRLDATSAPKLDEQLLSLATEKRSLILDLHGCDYVSSAGLRTLLAEAKRSKAAGRQFILCGLVPSVAEIVRIAGFDRIFTQAPTRADAERML